MSGCIKTRRSITKVPQYKYKTRAGFLYLSANMLITMRGELLKGLLLNDVRIS